MTVIEEGDLQITIGDAINVRKFDDANSEAEATFIGTAGASLALPAGSELWRIQHRVVEQPLPAISHSATKCGNEIAH